ncbi:MAG: NAD-dependent epimerase/dehydratase family protein [Spirochaetales bacterium]|nr:NAD-dependent epimerase/dehydratase family protein [Spirochaetales bacterium]
MKINIIGGSGFIGTRLVNRLNQKHEIRIIDKQASHFFPDRQVYADVRDTGSLRKAVDQGSVLVNLAAEHKDNIQPRSLYDDVNVQGARNICTVAEEKNITKILFTSSVAVYGFAPVGTDERGVINPFNDYGRTKWEAEKVFRAWAAKDPERTLIIIRPTVVFGERNRGNVYNLLRQIASGKFIMVGRGRNFKSMAYVENVAAFLEYSLKLKPGIHVYNYIDKPDFSMDNLVRKVNALVKNKDRIGPGIPYWLGYFGGLCFDLLSRISGKEFPVSAIRVRKFVSNTMFNSSIYTETDFKPPVDLDEALRKTIHFEFIDSNDGPLFYSE